MRFKNDKDNRYRVNFMRATEALIDKTTVAEFIEHLENNAELEDGSTHIYIDGKTIWCKDYVLKETDKLHKEFLVSFEKAKKRREDFIEELQGLERAQGTVVILDEISIYSYSCPTCQIKVMLNGGYGETVTCPVCERKIYRANDLEVMKVARGSRQAKVNNHYIQLDSYGRFKD